MIYIISIFIYLGCYDNKYGLFILMQYVNGNTLLSQT